MAIDPYAPPVARLCAPRPVAVLPAAGTVRASHYLHECGVRAVGVACGVFGVVMAGWGGLVALRLAGRAWSGISRPEGAEALFGITLLAAGALALAGAWGYVRLQPWVRWIAPLLACGAVVASLGLATPVVLYAAWLTWARKGRFILSGDYLDVVAQARGWPRWWQWAHVVVLVGAVAAYALAFHDAMTGGILPDQD